MQNFRDVAELAVRSGASIVATSAQELADRLKEILDNADKRTSMGTAARNLVDQNLGASRRYALAIGDLAEKAQKVKKTRKEKRMLSS
jgi:3-deoxy-D-manno-octulosonic-acid transferase